MLAARWVRPELLPTNRAQRLMQAAACGRVRRPTRSMAVGRAASTSAAAARSVAPGPPRMTGRAPGICVVRAWNRATKRSACQILPSQLAVGARAIRGAAAGRMAVAMAWSSGPIQATGRGDR